MAPRTTTKVKDVILALKVSGPAIRSGRISIPELVSLCQKAQNVVTRQAEAMEGRNTLHPGPVTTKIVNECTLELVGIRKGSTTLEFELARPQKKFDEALSFGSDAVRTVSETLKSLGNGNQTTDIDEGVLQGIHSLAGVVDNKRISGLKWVTPKGSGHNKRTEVRITQEVCERAATRLSQPRHAVTIVDGVLEMADFKPTDLRCRIQRAIGAPVACTFEKQSQNRIQELLRHPVRVSGEAKFYPASDRMKSLAIHEIIPLDSMVLGEDNFFSDLSMDSLAKMQDIVPLKKITSLSGGLSEDDDVDSFLEEIYEFREDK